MLPILPLVLTALSGISVQEQLDGTEIGDATQYIAFNSGGGYAAEHEDKKGKTVARGRWSVTGDRLEVKIASCKGPRCDTLGKSYSAQIEIVAERALNVKSTLEGGPLSSGSYYCRFQGCEKRTGVLLVTHGARANVMRYLLDYLIDKNRTRDVTVVWWGKKQDASQEKSSITWCPRDPERSKRDAALTAKDLSELGWFGKVPVTRSEEAGCLWDVKVVVGDTVELPPRR